MNGRGGEYNGVKFKSSWEIVFAAYCDLIGISYKYESQKAHSYKTWVSDFEVDGELYEVGWHDHVESIQAFETEGWICNLFKAEEISIMRDFLPRDIIDKYNIKPIDLKISKRNIKPLVENMPELRVKMGKKLDRTLLAKEVVWFKDNDPSNTSEENIILFKTPKDCITFRRNFKTNKYILKPTSEPTIFACEKEEPIVITCEKKTATKKCKGCEEIIVVNSKRAPVYCSIECHNSNSEIFPWPSKQELEKLIETMSMVKIAEFLREKTGQSISDNAVRKRCQKLGIELKPRGYWGEKQNGFVPPIKTPPVDKDALEKLVNKGLSCAKIAKEFDVHPITMSKWLKFYELSTKGMRDHEDSDKDVTDSESSFLCQYCDKTYKTKRGIIVHETHCELNPDYKAKIYSCKYCQQEFTKGYEVASHTLHCQSNPYRQ